MKQQIAQPQSRDPQVKRPHLQLSLHQLGPAPVVEPAPVEDPASALKQAVGLEPGANTNIAEVPDCPKEAALNNMKPPAPVSHTHVDPQGVANATAVAVTAVAGSPTVAAQHTIQTTLLALAREIRRPRAYVGYSAFILMGLLKKCQPCVWEGSSFTDVLEAFAPWAKHHCTKLLNATAVPCALVAQAGGSVELVPISSDHPLAKFMSLRRRHPDPRVRRHCEFL